LPHQLLRLARLPVPPRSRAHLNYSMIARRLALAAVLIAALLPARARAQDKDQICRDVQQRPMSVGQWASYRWTGGRSDGTAMRFAIVGTEAQAGGTYYWYELTIDQPQRGAKGKTIMQLLVPGLGYLSGGVRGLIMKTGDAPATRMPDQMVMMMGGAMAANVAAEFTRGCQEMEIVGWEDVTVPAGTFHALHLRNPKDQTAAWVRPELYFGMVKVVMKDGTMVLTGHGRGAKSSITEQPRPMVGP
jgi:hypothetical protein